MRLCDEWTWMTERLLRFNFPPPFFSSKKENELISVGPGAVQHDVV